MKQKLPFPTLFLLTLLALPACVSVDREATPISSPSTVVFVPVNTTIPPTLTPSPTATAVPATWTPVATETTISDNAPTPVNQNPVVITNAVTNVRLGPGLAYPVSHVLSAGTTAPILGRNNAGTWWAVPGPGDGPGPVGWISGAVVTVQGDVSNTPILTTPPLKLDIPVMGNTGLPPADGCTVAHPGPGDIGPLYVYEGPESPVMAALFINVGLMVLFGLPHSLMARRSFKQWWTKIIPPAAERSTYMLQSGLMALLLIWQWRPITQTVWQVENSVGSTLIWGLFWLGWLIAFISTLLINHFELTGLQQVYAYLRGQPATPLNFRTPFLYKIVRHPMQLGVMIAFWAAPHMTVGHLIFAVGMTTYILIGLYFEERDLVRRFGDTYREYQHTTPKLIPLPQQGKAKSNSLSLRRGQAEM